MAKKETKTWVRTERVRNVIATYGPEQQYITTKDVCAHLGLFTKAERKPVYQVMDQLAEQGELEKVGSACFKKKKPPEPVNKKTAMWKTLRTRRKVTVTDLMELAGVSQAYAEEFLYSLRKYESVKSEGFGENRVWILLGDPPVEMPDIKDNARKLKRLRAKKKELEKALNEIAAALGKAHTLLTEFEAEDTKKNAP